MKKTILLLMVLLISFLAYINCEPRVAVASTPWTIKQMTKNDVEDTLGTWQSISRDGRRLVFDRRPPPIWGPEGYGVNWDVFTMNVTDEAGLEKQMTSAYGEDVGAGISFDGNTIAFASGRFHVGEPWDLEIFAMNFADSPGQEVQVSDNTTYLDSGVSISGNGKTIAWHTGPDTPVKHSEYITIANISDINHIMYTIIDTPGWDMYPTLSYDGRKVCFSQHAGGGNPGVIVANTDGSGLTRIPCAFGEGVISGDGSKVAVLWNDGDWEFSIYDVATGNLVFRTDNNIDDWFGSINYHGDIVAYTRNGDIYSYNMQTMTETQLTNDACEDWYPRLDEDGDTIAFVSMGRDGPDAEIFVLMQAPSAPRNLIASPELSAIELVWSDPSEGTLITSFKIYRGDSSGSETFVASVDGNTHKYIDSSVSTSLYYYYITAVNPAAESLPSNEVRCSCEQSFLGIEAVVNLESFTTKRSLSNLLGIFTVQQNFEIAVGGSLIHRFWAQNVIEIWPNPVSKSSSLMLAVFEIWESYDGGVTWSRIVAQWQTISRPYRLQNPLILRSTIEGDKLIMKNNCKEYNYSLALSSYILGLGSQRQPEIVIVGPPSMPHMLPGTVVFKEPTKGHVDTYTRIGSDTGTWLQGENFLAILPHTGERSKNLKWSTGGDFQYQEGASDQGLFFWPDYDSPIVSPP